MYIETNGIRQEIVTVDNFYDVLHRNMIDYNHFQIFFATFLKNTYDLTPEEFKNIITEHYPEKFI